MIFRVVLVGSIFISWLVGYSFLVYFISNISFNIVMF